MPWSCPFTQELLGHTSPVRKPLLGATAGSMLSWQAAWCRTVAGHTEHLAGGLTALNSCSGDCCWLRRWMQSRGQKQEAWNCSAKCGRFHTELQQTDQSDAVPIGVSLWLRVNQEAYVQMAPTNVSSFLVVSEKSKFSWPYIKMSIKSSSCNWNTRN